MQSRLLIRRTGIRATRYQLARARIYRAPLSHPSIVPDVVESMLESDLSWVWTSSRNIRGHSWPVSSAPEQRPTMLLTTATKDQLVDDLLDRSDDGVGRSYKILGGNNNQTREWLSQGEAKSVEDFVTGRLIADVLITQFEDDWDYVCISEVSSTANLLAETVWGLDQATLLKPTPRWLQRIIQ